MRDEQPARVLVVDDEPYVREVICRCLATEGYQHTCAASLQEAWGLLQGAEFDAVLTDISMPGGSGIDLLAKIHVEMPNVAVVMVTASNDRDMAVKALQLGAYGYVMKPFHEDEIVINLANALHRRRLEMLRADYQHRLEEEVRAGTEGIRQREEEIILRLLSASEFRDDETHAHLQRIGLYSATMARVLGWDQQSVADLRLAAMMHDVGKIGIPDRILLKPGPLTADEYETMQEHTEIGARILEGSHIPLLCMGQEIALSHHERWDGMGYPQQLAGPDTPQAGRIVAVLDVYDALTNHRVYRPAMPEAEALALMRAESPGHFDPTLFTCFLDLLPQFRRLGQRFEGWDAQGASVQP
jgi:putative two-component system response regulator